jgi:hypothetical protein
VEAALVTLREACGGLVQWLEELRARKGPEESLRSALGRAVREMDHVDWLVPPMLQTR